MTRWCAALGFDPAPGDPAALQLVGRTAGRLAVELAHSATELRRVAVVDGVWAGEAAGAYRERLGTLPGRLDDAAGALGRLDRALQLFAARLEEAQDQARRLAERGADVATRLPEPAAQVELHALRQRALTLQAQLRRESRAAERALHQAAELAPADPGWLHRLVTEHARVLEVTSLALSVAAAVAAATGAGVPVAAALAATSFAATALLYHYGEADEADLLLATAGLLTFGVAAAAGGSTRLAVTTASAAPATVTALSVPAAPAGAGAAVRVATVADDVGVKLLAVNGYSVARDLAGELGRRRREREEDVEVVAPGRLRPVVVAPTG